MSLTPDDARFLEEAKFVIDDFEQRGVIKDMPYARTAQRLLRIVEGLREENERLEIRNGAILSDKRSANAQADSFAERLDLAHRERDAWKATWNQLHDDHFALKSKLADAEARIKEMEAKTGV